jgi:3'(2'), 5'-bisphosphate nucleotidase
MWESEKKIAIQAVRKASQLTQNIFKNLKTQANTITKQDLSPVTLADYGAQAIINSILNRHFPSTSIVAEEDAHMLYTQHGQRQTLLELIQSTVCLDKPFTEQSLLDSIDLGNGIGGPESTFWTLDPIDGTKGFLRGNQYAICLALICKGEVCVSIMGCPQLPFSKHESIKSSNNNSSNSNSAFEKNTNDQNNKNIELGCLFVAVKGQGAYQTSLREDDDAQIKIKVSPTLNTSEAKFCESFESGHSDQALSCKIAEQLRITQPSLKLDSQCKYGLLARGDCEFYFRFPVKPGYKENIWDHASGYLLVKEAGGQVTDFYGKDLDFTLGRNLIHNQGILASNGKLHSELLQGISKNL